MLPLPNENYIQDRVDWYLVSDCALDTFLLLRGIINICFKSEKRIERKLEVSVDEKLNHFYLSYVNDIIPKCHADVAHMHEG